MTRLIWDETDSRKYENGVSHGVLYPPSGSGVVWNGLISVQESFSGGDSTVLYYDGKAFMNLMSNRDFQATVQSLSTPKEFAQCQGEVDLVPGFSLTAQPRSEFGMAYRTEINDTDYKIHMIYNATATPTGRSYLTLKDEISPAVYSWKVDCVPPEIDNHIPTAHIVADSSKSDPDSMAALLDILYGTNTENASLPTIVDLIDLWT